MRGIGIKQYGDIQQLTEIELPTKPIGPDDLLISIKASGVNPVDWKVREGLLQADFPFELPLILGWDAAGTVTAVGTHVQDFQIGDDVFFRPELEREGTYADEIVVPANIVAPMPRGLSYAEAASLPLVGLTVWQALVEVGNVQAGDKVLVLGGSGGIGSMAIQLAKALGAYVATTTSSKNSDYVRELGADEVIVYDQGSLHTSTQFTFMLDTLGGEAYGEALKFMKRQGRVATIISERDARKPSFADAVEKERELDVSFVFTRPDRANMNHIRELVEAKRVKPCLTKIYPLTIEGVRDAHLFSQTGRVRGKIVLVHS
ncbi:NADP-dependent oxidoreductase [Brevibacillus formosus]|uniref:NADPH:quinone reductase n=1 Tax=Brevibacillus formosus TaxID=54913 RepID=A0A837KSH5_9BACL|nr:NADP-dependent oxidoreductase [Brevibacillus formosus]KLH99992.1 oxidoreductase [Brevibacillus formosus]MED1959429.1 NADP-dependent oxidoreductase [Brevibacillus formosus]PSJ96055.1 NADP-dependent oxidoreductase [Brevibacillus formosus]GED56416.1 NADPH:quinone reductase [Brevibacillus formosus]